MSPRTLAKSGQTLSDFAEGCRARLITDHMEAIRANAATWADKVLRARRTALNQLKKITQIHPPSFESCARDSRCDRGDILSRRLGMRVSCAHVPVGAELQAERPEQFEFGEEGSPRIDIDPELSGSHFSRTRNE
jgi:hypothetical protein